MSYGWERLIAAREGPNNRRAFDEVRLLYKQNAVSVALEPGGGGPGTIR
jgi:hypothetical protein